MYRHVNHCGMQLVATLLLCEEGGFSHIAALQGEFNISVPSPYSLVPSPYSLVPVLTPSSPVPISLSPVLTPLSPVLTAIHAHILPDGEVFHNSWVFCQLTLELLEGDGPTAISVSIIEQGPGELIQFVLTEPQCTFIHA